MHRRRELARVTFLVLRDRSGLAQVVLPAGTAVPPEETTVEVTGTATANPQAPGGVEVTEAVVTALTDDAETPPFELWRPELNVSLPTLLDHAPVAWRHPAQKVRWELAAASLRGFRRTLDALGFTEIQTPKFVESATESGANVFEVDYFGRPAYLAQSPQFYKQQLVGVFERVYEVGPVFRAEPHDTVRHLAEYVSLDVELGFIDDHRDVLAVLREVLRRHARVSSGRWPSGPARTLPGRARGDPGRALQRGAGDRRRARPTSPTSPPSTSGRSARGRASEHGSDFLAVEGYPMAKRPFYTHPQPSDPRWSNSFDLLFRGLELVTGGQRLHRLADHERGDPGARRGPGGVRGVPPGVPARHAPARRLRHRAGAVGRPARRGGQHPRGDALPARPEPAVAVAVVPGQDFAPSSTRRASAAIPGLCCCPGLFADDGVAGDVVRVHDLAVVDGALAGAAEDPGDVDVEPP